MSFFTKLLALIVVALSGSLFLAVKQIEIKNAKIETLALTNSNLEANVKNLTVNIKKAVDVNSRLNSIIEAQNTSINDSATLVKSLEKKVKQHKHKIVKIQEKGSNFDIPNTGISAEENIAYLLRAAIYLVRFDPSNDAELELELGFLQDKKLVSFFHKKQFKLASININKKAETIENREIRNSWKL